MTTDLKVGDKIFVDNRLGDMELHIIERVTATMYVTGFRKFRKESLRIVGADSWGPRYGHPATKEMILKFRISRASRALNSIKVTEQNIDVVEQLIREAK